MATIGTTIFTQDGTKNFILLNNNEQYLRKFNIGPNWTYMNAGVLYSCEGTSNISGGLWLGFGSSANGNFGAKSITSCSILLGSCFGLPSSVFGMGDTYAIMTYNNTDISGSYFSNPLGYNAVVSGGVKQASNGNVTANYTFTTEPPNRKGLFVVHCYRDSYTVTAPIYVSGQFKNVISSSLGTNHNHTINSLHSALQGTDNSVLIDNVLATQTSATALNGWDPVRYPIDTINLFWTGSSKVRIYGLSVSVIF